MNTPASSLDERGVAGRYMKLVGPCSSRPARHSKIDRYQGRAAPFVGTLRTTPLAFQRGEPAMKILMVPTSHERLGETGEHCSTTNRKPMKTVSPKRGRGHAA
jgi:hypothetical protein